jgi:hypothetical protein
LKASNIQGDPFRVCVEAIVVVITLLDASPTLALARARQGTTRQAPKHDFFARISFAALYLENVVDGERDHPSA